VRLEWRSNTYLADLAQPAQSTIKTSYLLKRESTCLIIWHKVPCKPNGQQKKSTLKEIQGLSRTYCGLRNHCRFSHSRLGTCIWRKRLTQSSSGNPRGVSVLLLEFGWMEGRTHPSNCRIIVVIQLREKGLSAKIAPRAGK
jgi:hypothetical protein